MIRYINGDCRHVIPSLNTNVQSVITSPPYFNLRNYGNEGEIGCEVTLEAYLSNLIDVFKLIKNVLNEDGTLWVNLGDTYAKKGACGPNNIDRKSFKKKSNIKRKIPKGYRAKCLIGTPWLFAFEMIKIGYNLRSDIIWSKPNPVPENVKDRPTRSHEYFFLFSKNNKYYYDNEAIKEKSKASSMRRFKYKGNARYQDKRNIRDVWTIASNTRNRSSHCSTFPYDLIRPAILASTKPNDIILDPFCGVGTVGKLCKEMNRDFVGIELDKAFYDLSIV
jgi:DNA modification methylase